MSFENNPGMKDSNNQNIRRQHVHQPLTNEHFGIVYSIKENGRVVIRSKPHQVDGTDEYEYDEVDIPASLIFKLATLLKATRTTTYTNVEENKK